MKACAAVIIVMAFLSACVSGRSRLSIDKIEDGLRGGLPEQEVLNIAGTTPKTIEFQECGGDDGYSSWRCKVYEYQDRASSGRLRIFFSSEVNFDSKEYEWFVENWIVIP